MMELEFTGATNPKWADASGDYLSCTATFEEYGDEPINITVGRQFEPEYPHRSVIFSRVEAGEFGAIAPFVAPPLPVPSFISDRQFFQQMAIEGTITEEQAIAAASVGTIPPPLQVIVDALPADQKFAARMLLMGATQIERAHPMTDAVGSATGRTSEQIDDFFRAAILL